MEIKDMNLQEVTERLAALDAEVREAQDVEFIEKAKEEKKALLERKAELEEAETRKAQAEALAKEEAQPEKVIERSEERKMEKTYGIESEEYRSAWAKNLMHQTLNEEEQRAYASTDAANAIPTSVANKFFEKMKKLAPMLSEITLMQVAGNIKFMAEGTRNAVSTIHTENASVDPSADTVVSVELGGKEFMKVIRISKAAETMSVGQFEDWLVNMLAGDIARAIDNYIINDSTNGLVGNVESTATKVLATATTGYTYKDVLALVALLPAAYDAEAKFLVNKKTLYNEIDGILDKNDRPIFNPVDKTLMGYPVVIDDYVPTNHNQVYLGKLSDIVGNLSQPVVVDRSTESGFLNNSIDFRGTAIFESKLAKKDAIVWLANA